MTALNIAASKCNLEIIKYFIETCHPNAKSISKYTIAKVKEMGNLELAKYLIEKQCE